MGPLLTQTYQFILYGEYNLQNYKTNMKINKLHVYILSGCHGNGFLSK